MSKKKLFVASAICVAVGSVVALSGCSIMGFDLRNLDSRSVQTKEYQIDQQFNNIAIDRDSANVRFIVAQDDAVKVVSKEKQRQESAVSVQDGTLTIATQNTRKWYDYMFNSKETSVEVYLPATVCVNLTVKGATGDVYLPQNLSFGAVDIDISTGDVYVSSPAMQSLSLDLSTGDVQIANTTVANGISIQLSTGDIEMQGVTAQSLTLQTTTGGMDLENITVAGALQAKRTTGEADLENVQCGELSLVSDTGSVEMKNVVATQKMYVETSTGDVEFSDIDAPEIVITTDTGDVEGSLQSGKIYTYETSIDKVHLPAHGDNGTCYIKTNTGDIRITVR